jgi:hypothetical protein
MKSNLFQHPTLYNTMKVDMHMFHASFFHEHFYPEEGGSILLRKVCRFHRPKRRYIQEHNV